MQSSYKVDKLGNYIEQIRGVSYKPQDVTEEQKEGYKVILRANSIKNNKLILNDLVYVKEELIKEKQFIKSNDILMAASSGSKEVVGKCAQIKNDTEYTFGAFCKLIRCKENINSNYVSYFLRTPYYRSTISAVVNGANINNLKNEHIDNLDIPLPSLETQKKIVEVLDKAQELIDKRKEQIEALDELVKSRFIEMFGDISRNSKKWDITKLDELVDVVSGYAFKSTEFVDEGIPVLKIGNINAGYFKPTNLMFWIKDEKLDKYLIKPNDLVISLTGTVGKDDYGNVCIMGDDYEEYYLNQRNAKLDIKNENLLDKYYLTYVLKVPEVKKRLTGISRGVRQANIANKDIQNLEVPIPPIELQHQFSDFVNQVDKLKSQMESSLKELEDNFNSLMQKAFKGELF